MVTFHLQLSEVGDTVVEDDTSRNLMEKLQASESPGYVEIWHHMPFALEKKNNYNKYHNY